MPEVSEPMSEGIDPERLECWRRVSRRNHRAILRAVGMPREVIDGQLEHHHIDPDQKGNSSTPSG